MLPVCGSCGSPGDLLASMAPVSSGLERSMTSAKRAHMNTRHMGKRGGRDYANIYFIRRPLASARFGSGSSTRATMATPISVSTNVTQRDLAA